MNRSGTRARVVGPVVVLAILLVGCVPPPPPPKPAVLDAACNGTLVASTPGTVASSALDELSGIAASHLTDDVWWVHNDSGDVARVFAVGTDGRDLGEFDLAGASAVDWEDIAVGPGPGFGAPHLYIGDIGDNAKSRSSVTVYRVREPATDQNGPTPPPTLLTDVDALTLVYPDGPHDAEALFVDPSSGELFVVTKELSGNAQIFRAPASLPDGSTTTLEQVATVSLGFLGAVTAADVTPAGDVVALRTYFSVVVFPRPVGSPLASAFAQPSCNGAVASEAQGEALGFTRNGHGYMTASEGAHPPLHEFVAP